MLPKIGIIGCGKISAAYLRTLTTIGRPFVEVAACADLLPAAAEARAAEFGVPRTATVPELLEDPTIPFIANLTIPEAHAEVNRAALEAGKHVYTEKPLALSMADARALHALARERGLMLSCAPDTLLGSSHQLVRHLLDHALLEPVTTAFAQIHMGGPATPAYMRAASGPLLDMGPYFVGALTYYLGPIRRVAALGGRDEMEDKDGQSFTPEAPSRVAAAIEFASGATGAISLTRFGDWYAPRVELFGRSGNLVCADPNGFNGPVLLKGAAPEGAFPDFSFAGRDRGAGLIEMALALEEGRDCRLNADFCLHSLEVLLAILESLDTGRAVTLTTTCAQPAALPPIPGLEKSVAA